MLWTLFQSLKETLSTHLILSALCLRSVAFLVLALNGWSDGRDHFPALVIVLLSTSALLFCIHVIAIRSRQTRRQVSIAKRRLRFANAEILNCKSKLRSIGQVQKDCDLAISKVNSSFKQKCDVLLQNHAKLPVDLERLENFMEEARDRFSREAMALRTRSINALRSDLTELQAVAFLSHQLKPRIFGVRFNRTYAGTVTQQAESEFIESIDQLIASSQPKN